MNNERRKDFAKCIWFIFEATIHENSNAKVYNIPKDDSQTHVKKIEWNGI